MEKRAFLAVFLSFIVLYLYFIYVSPPPQPSSVETHMSGSDAGSGEAEPMGTLSEENRSDKTNGLDGDPSTAATVDGGSTLEKQGEQNFEATPDSIDEQFFTIESDLYSAVLSNKGAHLQQFILHKYKDKVGEDAVDYQMIWQGQTRKNFPLTISFQDVALNSSFEAGSYICPSESPHIRLNETEPFTEIIFERIDQSGVKVTKKITFHHDSYVIDVDLSVENLGQRTRNLSWNLAGGAGIGPEGSEKSQLIHVGPIFQIEENNKLTLEKIDADDLENGERTYKIGMKWVGYGSPYFCNIMVPDDNGTYYGTAEMSNKEVPAIFLKSPLVDAMPGTVYQYRIENYIGPKATDQLEKAPGNIINIIDYGFFHIIAAPLFKLLKFFHEYLHSWGLAIIALTILIKILFYPLTRSSFQSMDKMKKVQPEVNDIRAKYKDDPQKMNKEVWDVYRKHKVNPMGSCFPMLLQIPVFFALYRVLYAAIELRHASFLYIPDLSAFDPYYISPILMGASMLLQQQMTPMMGDPKQAQVMKLMPIIFTVMFIYFPSGLVIYWLVNNVITIGQQYMIKRKSDAAAEPVVVENEKARKKGKRKKG